MQISEYPDFDAAVEKLRALLADLDWPTRIEWIRLVGDSDNVRESCEEAARRDYVTAVSNQLGVALDARFVRDGSAHVAVTYPRDVEEKELLMYCDGLKLSVSQCRDQRG